MRLRRTSSVPAIAAVAAPFGRDVPEALVRIEAIVARARARGAELVVLPEASIGGYLYEPRTATRRTPVGPPPALDPDGPELAELARIAGPTVVCAGYTEAGPDGLLYASAVCVSGDGVLGRQRKVHLPPGERAIYSAGEGFSAFDTPVGRIGMLVC